MKAGDCVYGIMPKTGTIKHYWVILCNPCPNGLVAVVNFTSPTGAAKAHIFPKASFDTLKYDSEVAWAYAAVFPAEAIKKALDAKLFESQPAMEAQALTDLIRGGDERRLIRRDILKKINGG